MPDQTPLTDAELDAIRDRSAALATSIGGETRQQGRLADDVPVLLAEVDRLRALAPEPTRAPAVVHSPGSTAETGSTGVPEPHARSEAAEVPNTATERIAQIRAQLDGCERGPQGQIGLSAEMFMTAGRHLYWLLDHVDRLNTVLSDEVPDVDGWTVHPRAGGGLIVTHDIDADRPVLLSSESMPVGAVLAFIADQKDPDA